MHKYVYLFYLLILIGVITRTYLAFTLPIWHDEAYSLWASHEPMWRILSGVTDPVHPPGYYVFLRLASVIADHLLWYRTITVILSVINMVWIFKLSKRILPNSPTFPYLCTLLYTYSGYFIVFDWQIRMYTGLTSIILISFFFLTKYMYQKSLKKYIVIFTFLNVVGLYFDYGYLWYVLPLVPVSAFIWFIKHQKVGRIMLVSLIISGIIFGLIYPNIFMTYRRGINGISWVKDFLHPSFFIPYFLGTHKQMYATWFYIFTLLYGVFIWYTKKAVTFRTTLFLCLGLTSGYITYIYSLAFIPIFHERSLQIIAMNIIILLGIALQDLLNKQKWAIFGSIVLVIIINFFTVVHLIPTHPYDYLLSFFPWKSIKQTLDMDNTTFVYLYPQSDLPTPILLWGLEYTLQGKESAFSRAIPYQLISNDLSANKQCKLIHSSYIYIYACQT